MFIYESEVHVAYNFNRLIEIEGLLKVTCSHMHYTCGKSLEMVQNRDIATTDH